MVTSCDPINPYTDTKTFGVSYNGGYKPDPTLEWIPADTNVVDSSDDFIRPPTIEPANTYLKTCEARRFDPRIGGVPERQIEYDDFTEYQQIQQVEPPPAASPIANNENMMWKIMILSAIILLVLLLSSRF